MPECPCSWPWKSSYENFDEVKRRFIHINDEPSRNAFASNAISNTKYNPITFLPKNLMEQFRFHMNRYFLLIACLQLWNEITPVSPITTWGPLIVIFLLSAAKEAYDDLGRYRRDREANSRSCKIVKNGTVVTVESADIHVGDIVKVMENESFPCDLLLLKVSPSEMDGSDNDACYIQTSNLDGETDFKTRSCLSTICNLSDSDIYNIQGVIECAEPNGEIYSFDSTLTVTMPISSPKLVVDVSQLLPQSTILKNSNWIFGVAVYTGNETKIGMNRGIAQKKSTATDIFINRLAIIIFCFQLCVVLTFGIAGILFNNNLKYDAWYLSYSNVGWYMIIVIPLRFLLLNSYMIPISLKVTLDFSKLVYSRFIQWDINMYDSDIDVAAHANNTAISEDLGQIQAVFTDKTGTLTQNIMEFRKCLVAVSDNDVCIYEELNSNHDSVLESHLSDCPPILRSFLQAIALCHSCISVAVSNGEGTSFDYKSASPDEETLVKFAARYGVKFVSRRGSTLEIDDNTSVAMHSSKLGKNLRTYTCLHTLSFSSERKRMSVIVKDSHSGEIFLFMKGADDVVLSRSNSSVSAKTLAMTRVYSTVDQFASEGYRTLCVAMREIPNDVYSAWAIQMAEATMLITGRDAAVAAVFETIECNLIILGVTAVEDLLQKDVSLTIRSLREAGIRFWMLTGDKRATAMSIAMSCSLMSQSDGNNSDHIRCIISGSADEILSSIKGALSRLSELHNLAITGRPREVTIIVDGSVVIAIALDRYYAELSELLLHPAVHSVICCRVSPKQKAAVVQLAMVHGLRVLAIGDGGNDVPMIQQAHVGVGIWGKEGLQAARASDYSISQFRFLKRLLLVHGRYSYYRTSFIGHYCFYKSIVLCIMQLCFSCVCAFSGSSWFNDYALTTYNVVFTFLPVLFFTLDKDVSMETVMQFPRLYRHGIVGDMLTYKSALQWFCLAVCQGIVIFSYVYVTPTRTTSGIVIDGFETSMIAFSALVLLQTVTVAIAFSSYTILHLIVLVGTIITFFLLTLIFNLFPSYSLYGAMNLIFSQPIFWFLQLLLLVVCLIVPSSIKSWGFLFYPTDIQSSAHLSSSDSDPSLNYRINPVEMQLLINK